MNRTRARLWAVVALATIAGASAGVAAQPAGSMRGIWISPPRSAAAIPPIARAVRAANLDTIVMPVFFDGRTVYPSRVFPQHDAHVGSDPASVLIEETHRRGMRALAALDVLYWQSSPNPSPAVSNHTQWLERTAEGRVIGDESGTPGAFVSPCEPRVKSLLADLAAELAARYEFDGVVLDYARWSQVDFLGYAEVDRKLYLAERQTDPLDVDLLGYATPDKMAQDLARWQEQQITAVARAMAEAFARGRPRGMVLAVVGPQYYRNRDLNPMRQDWRSWLSQGWVRVVVPRGIEYADQASARATLRAASGSDRVSAVALIRRTAGSPIRQQTGVVAELGLPGFILWTRDSVPQQRAILRELGAW